jgi:hypothetical protein
MHLGIGTGIGFAVMNQASGTPSNAWVNESAIAWTDESAQTWTDS